MQYYKLKPSADALKSQKPLTGQEMTILFDAKSGDLLIQSKDKLPSHEGLQKSTKNKFSDMQKAASKSKKQAVKNLRNQAGIGFMGAVDSWEIEPFSTRKGSIRQVSFSEGKPALSVQFEGGRGNMIFLGREFEIPKGISRIRIRCLSRSGGEEVRLGIVFTTPKERPWLELEPVVLKNGIQNELEFSWKKIDKTALQKTNRLVVAIQADGDEGFCLLQDIDLLA